MDQSAFSFKYLTQAEEDLSWGLYLNTAGKVKVGAGSPYPPEEHPSGYYFDWEEGRILNEYQINYITEGRGVLETREKRFEIGPGSILIIHPGYWHRYRPLRESGWVENYVGFSGPIAGQFMSRPAFSAREPVMQLGIREELLDTYLKIMDLVEAEPPAFQQIASGMIIKLLGYIVSFRKQQDFSNQQVVGIIDQARFHMRSSLDQALDLQELAEDLNVSYSYFRQMFKKYTGMPPGQYHQQLKLIRAKELLSSTDRPVGQISQELGFQSIHYFSKLFRQKTGLSPMAYRKQSWQGHDAQ